MSTNGEMSSFLLVMQRVVVASVNKGVRARGAGAAKAWHETRREQCPATADELGDSSVPSTSPSSLVTTSAQPVTYSCAASSPHHNSRRSPASSKPPLETFVHLGQDGVGGDYDSVRGATLASWKLQPTDDRTGWTTVRAAGMATMCKETTGMLITDSCLCVCSPSRFEAQEDAVNLIFSAKIQSNPESSVGLMSMGATGPEVLTTLTTDMGKILDGLHRTKIRGSPHFSTGINIAAVRSSASISCLYFEH